MLGSTLLWWIPLVEGTFLRALFGSFFGSCTFRKFIGIIALGWFGIWISATKYFPCKSLMHTTKFEVILELSLKYRWHMSCKYQSLTSHLKGIVTYAYHWLIVATWSAPWQQIAKSAWTVNLDRSLKSTKNLYSTCELFYTYYCYSVFVRPYFSGFKSRNCQGGLCVYTIIHNIWYCVIVYCLMWFVYMSV